MGVVIDGCPAGLFLQKEEIEAQLVLRRPGRNRFTSPREEPDKVEILSGLFEGKTTGAPLCIWIANQDADSSSYEEASTLYRPGHAHFTYLAKYGIFDPRGGGRASARETVGRVAAGAVAKRLLAHFGIVCRAYLSELGGIAIGDVDVTDWDLLREKIHGSPLFCPDPEAEEKMREKLAEAQSEGDSLGGVVSGIAHVPKGLGDPMYAKLEAVLASAMLSIPASKGFEIGAGFASARMKGSEHNDPFDVDEEGNVYTKTNFAGGTLGGISTGAPLLFKVPFKPTSSIKKSQETINVKGEKVTYRSPATGRHDPCVAIRAVPVVEAMTALVLADALLMQRSSLLKNV